MALSRSTPGVYIEEKNAFPNSIVAVPTSVPAFVGYTEKAMQHNKHVTNIPVRISSWGEYEQYFGGPPKTSFQLKTDPGSTFQLSPAGARFYLFDCLRLYFANGGTDCYIVSIGNYADIKQPVATDFSGGIDALKKEQEPTLLLCPDTVALADAGASAVVHQAMLDHCATMQSRFAILDIWGGYRERTLDDKDVITLFRSGVQNNLQWGAAYYPWVHTNFTDLTAVDFTDVATDSLPILIGLLQAELQQALKSGQLRDQQTFEAIKKVIATIATTTDPDKVKILHQTLQSVSPLYVSILKSMLPELNLLPPGAGIAGIFCTVDQSTGVFHAPANVSMTAVISPAVQISSTDQEDLNAPLDGKSVCALRVFPGKGLLVWGARTLDGNSQDWRYINVRRTLIFLEQSIKIALRDYVFAPNDVNTWVTVKSMIENFLTNFWKDGGLAGAKPDDAFSVQIGLGSTMTAQDILDGYLRVTVLVAVTRPAEFLVITLEQEMAKS